MRKCQKGISLYNSRQDVAACSNKYDKRMCTRLHLFYLNSCNNSAFLPKHIFLITSGSQDLSRNLERNTNENYGLTRAQNHHTKGTKVCLNNFLTISTFLNIFVNMNKVRKELSVNSETLFNAYTRLQKEHGFKKPFLKMDTQGYDVLVLKHGEEIIHNFIGLQSELAVNKLYKDSIDYREAITKYEQYGFSLSAFVPNNEGHFPRLIEIDCIMVRNDLLYTKPADS